MLEKKSLQQHSVCYLISLLKTSFCQSEVVQHNLRNNHLYHMGDTQIYNKHLCIYHTKFYHRKRVHIVLSPFFESFLLLNEKQLHYLCIYF